MIAPQSFLKYTYYFFCSNFSINNNHDYYVNRLIVVTKTAPSNI